MKDFIDHLQEAAKKPKPIVLEAERLHMKSFKSYISEKKVKEDWSKEYKRSINCNNPKGFSQRAHCQGRKKR